MSSEHISRLETEAKNHRNFLLKESDWTQVADSPVDLSAWAQYRKELRDLTTQDDFPEKIIWPKKPK